ncbi:MAG: SDR family NAD(P)-dependent oxidoreductase [Treponema sp.]|nr:SDR family NAD(P)-dependent oxidoreductase [Treponema sp.]
MKVAIVTGASSGLGKEFLKLLDKNHKIDELWLVARRQSLMEEFSSELTHKSRVFALDITQESSLVTLENALKEEPDTQVAYLINCAGYGKVGTYYEIDPSVNANMIDLDCRAPVCLTQMVLNYMPRGGNIIQVCSVAAFMPMPVMSVYAASKAFLYRYTRALRWELSGMGVKVSALCPFWIKDTEFISTSKKELKDGGSVVKNFRFASKAKSVAKKAIFYNKLNYAVITPGFVSTFLRVGNKIVPACISVPLWNLWRKL